MKLPVLLTAATLSLGTFLPHEAKAGSDKALAAIGGFIGGVIVGSHLERSHHPAPVIVDHCPPPPRVVVVDRHGPPHRHGYWETSRVRVWVPGRTVWVVDECGRSVRRYEPGHYEYRSERVWVESRGRRHW